MSHSRIDVSDLFFFFFFFVHMFDYVNLLLKTCYDFIPVSTQFLSPLSVCSH